MCLINIVSYIKKVNDQLYLHEVLEAILAVMGPQGDKPTDAKT